MKINEIGAGNNRIRISIRKRHQSCRKADTDPERGAGLKTKRETRKKITNEWGAGMKAKRIHRSKRKRHRGGRKA